MLKIKDINKSYNKNTVLKQINFSISEGEIVLYMGSNGSGKTTTFRIIAGLIQPDKGSVSYEEKEISKRDIGYLCDERSLYTDCTLREHAKLICDMNHISRFESEFNKLAHVLKIEQYKDTRIDKLSKGNRQKASWLMCLIKNPKIILLDEPFTALDRENIELLKKVIIRLKRDNKIVIISSHQIQSMMDVCDRYLYLCEGIIAFDITKEKLRSNPQKIVSVQQDCNQDFLDKAPHYYHQNRIRYCLKNIRQAKKFVRRILDNDEFISVSIEDMTVLDYKEFCL